jgi:hypothetical protein
MQVTVVKFNPEGDGVTALYIDGKKHTHGDFYHDKIDDWIAGFIEGLKFAEVNFEEAEDEIPGDKCKLIHQSGQEPPMEWPDRKYYKHRTIHEGF